VTDTNVLVEKEQKDHYSEEKDRYPEEKDHC